MKSILARFDLYANYSIQYAQTRQHRLNVSSLFDMSDKKRFPSFLYTMKKIIYIIPGLGERCDESQYQDLAQALEKKGYSVHQVNPNWYRPLLEQIFPVEKDAIVFGFSFGAIIAYLVAQKYPCKKVLLASLSPLETFSFESLVDDYAEYMSKDLAVEIATDVKKIDISLQSLKTPFVTLAGDAELKDITDSAHILVPGTGHKITKAYIKYILELCE
jgi:hypothetical protein